MAAVSLLVRQGVARGVDVAVVQLVDRRRDPPGDAQEWTFQRDVETPPDLAQNMMAPDASLPDGWAIGWSNEHARPYYFNEAMALTQWTEPSYPRSASAQVEPNIEEPSPSASAQAEQPDVDGLGVKALKELVASAGLSSADCLDKAELRARAREAIRLRPLATEPGGKDEAQQRDEAQQHDARAEAAIESVLGFVDPIVHAAAAQILHEHAGRPDATARLRKHLDAADAAACVDALFQSGSLSQAGGSASSEEGEEEEENQRDAAEAADSDRMAPWMGAPASGAAASNGLHAAGGSCDLHADLHGEILAFAKWVQPRTCEVRARSAIKRLVARHLQALGTGMSVEAYGSSKTGMSLFCSDVDLHFFPPAPLKEVASLLCESRESSGRRAFVDIDVLGSAQVPIVCMTHAATRVEIDLSCAVGQHDTATPRLVRDAVAEHAQMRPMALVLKVLLMQRGLHETFLGGIGSFKLYVLLAAWLSGRRGSRPSERGHLGDCLIEFLQAHATGLGRQPISHRGVEADLSRVRLADCMAAFAEAARALAQHHRLGAVIDAPQLQRMRQRSLSKSEAFTTALLAGRGASATVADGPTGVGDQQSHSGAASCAASRAASQPRAPSAWERPHKAPRTATDATEKHLDLGGGKSIFEYVQ